MGVKRLTNLSPLAIESPKLLLKLERMLPNVSSWMSPAFAKLLACSLLGSLCLIQLGSLK